jgi:hypothetical protein
MATQDKVATVRRRVVLVLLACMLIGLPLLMFLHPRSAHDVPSSAGAGPRGPASAASAPASASASASASAAASQAAPAAPKRSLARPLRVAASGWDTAAPLILANGGLDQGKDSALAALGVDVKVVVTTADSAPEAALARGGEDASGADVVIMPLPEFVASYERLRALGPQIFLVTGWSRGREGVWSQRDSFANVPAKGVTLGGGKNDAARWVALFTLGLAGVPASAVNLTPPDKGAPMFFAADRRDESQASGAKLLLTTADAPRLSPVVAIAQSVLLEKHADVLTAWATGLLQGELKVQADAAGAARAIGALPGAPEPLVMVRRLGELAGASLYDNARVFGVSGRSPVTLEQLFSRGWQVWRDARVLSTPAPDTVPVTPAILAAIVRASPGMLEPAAPAQPKEGGLLVSYRIQQSKPDEAALVTEVGFVAGVFERSVLRVGVLGGAGVDEARTRKLIKAVSERFELAPGRLVPVKAAAGDKAAALIEVLAAP